MRHYHGGIADWKEAGLPVESAPATPTVAAVGAAIRAAARVDAGAPDKARAATRYRAADSGETRCSI